MTQDYPTSSPSEGSAATAYDVVLTIGGRTQPQRTNLGDVIKMAPLALVSFVLGGPDKPTAVVSLRDRRTGAVVLRHRWRWDPDAATRDHEAIAAALQTMSVAQFEAEYGIGSA